MTWVVLPPLSPSTETKPQTSKLVSDQIFGSIITTNRWRLAELLLCGNETKLRKNQTLKVSVEVQCSSRLKQQLLRCGGTAPHWPAGRHAATIIRVCLIDGCTQRPELNVCSGLFIVPNDSFQNNFWHQIIIIHVFITSLLLRVQFTQRLKIAASFIFYKTTSFRRLHDADE